jgi:hypothetical protein
MINPGGHLSIDEIVGRTAEVARYWTILERQSLVLGAERRIGKTHIVLKMHEEGRTGAVTFFQELEAIHGVLELVRSVYRTVRDHLPRAARAKARAIEVWDGFLPTKLGNLELPQAFSKWKALLSGAIEDVLDAVEPDHKVIFIWDEFPLMLYNIVQREGPNTAIELLDLLRHLRQMHGARLRFLLNGSIGLHLVLRGLRKSGNSNAPINDMQLETVPPMIRTEAEEVATRALGHLPSPPPDIPAVAALIVDATGGYPYHVHHFVDQLSLLGRAPMAADVEAVVTKLLSDDDDVANFGYYVERISTHYDAPEVARALAVLDAIARADGGITLETLTNLVRHSNDQWTDEDVKATCVDLRRDHYLSLSGGLYGFRWPLLKRWWRENRT